ncbi:Cytidylate kinase [hydrothermal vent metagenome]|uniref:(d)CMP kinase n=1 Tax=hydrothermal vent metagenome TaxID=652676 RepID=A0A3B0RMY1_9ZZZZ
MTVIAIDGPAASGKGTLARRLAQHFDYAYLDTGSLYRAVALEAHRTDGDAIKAAQNVGKLNLTDPKIKSESTGGMASKISALAEVRAALLDFQRDFAARPPEGKAGAVLDGRDIGTVVCPDADVKIFITADVKTRAKRRFLEEFGAEGHDADYQAILADLIQRDERDMTRPNSPLRAAANAHLLDTTNSDIEAVFEQALKLVSDKMTTA